MINLQSEEFVHNTDLKRLQAMVAAYGIVAEHSQHPLTCAMLFGISGGLDARLVLQRDDKRHCRQLLFGRPQHRAGQAQFSNAVLNRLAVSSQLGQRNADSTRQMPIVLSKGALKAAMQKGIGDMLKRAWSQRQQRWCWPGLETLANLLLNARHSCGWLKPDSGLQLYLTARDLFIAMEIASDQGGFYRQNYADFLAEASTLDEFGDLTKAAKHYAHIANGWRELADLLLPDQAKLLKDTKMLLRKHSEQDHANKNATSQLKNQLRPIERQIASRGFPWGVKRRYQWLEGLREQLMILIQMEYEALASISNAMR